MHVILIFLFVVLNIIKSEAAGTCVAIYIDGYYPLYSSNNCAIDSSPLNTSTTHTCSRFTCNNESWVAPCSSGEMTTELGCLTGTCKKRYSATCQQNRFITGEYRYGGTCSFSDHDGPDGTLDSCENAGGTWTWMDTMDKCRDFAVNKGYTLSLIHI